MTHKATEHQPYNRAAVTAYHRLVSQHAAPLEAQIAADCKIGGEWIPCSDETWDCMTRHCALVVCTAYEMSAQELDADLDSAFGTQHDMWMTALVAVSEGRLMVAH